MSIPDVLREYGAAFRHDWAEIDGRSVRDEMETLAVCMELSTAPADEHLRIILGLCPLGNGHWEPWCSELGCES